MKVYIHLGLPKTGTTTLQNTFDLINEKNFFYVGKRNNNSNTNLYNCIVAYASLKKNDEVLKLEIQAQLNEIEEENVLVSEEMFLVDTRVDWQEKVRRLVCLFSLYDVKIVLFVRYQVDAIYSFLVEMHNIYKDLTVEEFLVSNQFKIFDYHYLVSFLRDDLNVKRIYVYDFESSFSNLDFWKCDFVLSPFLKNADVEDNRSNDKQKIRAGYFANKKSLYDLLHGFGFLRNLFKWLGLGFKIKIILFMKKINISRSKLVPYLSIGQKQLICYKLIKKQELFDSKFDLAYAERMRREIR